jgi:pantoate--beta-alanine ligase
MQIVRTVAETRAALRALRSKGLTVGLVPTMGALHAGHLSLVRAAREQCEAVVVSIFVNPTQFGPNEDFSKYPRTFDTDGKLLEEEKVDVLFAPGVDEMYPSGSTTFVTVEEIGDRLDGASRPGHFRGVATVVAKLFHIIEPDKAYFGQKDAAQIAVLRRMVRDLNFPLELIACPTVREPDGLAMSSRNRYLSSEDRTHALTLSKTLFHTEQRIAAGTFTARTLIDDAVAALAAKPHIRLDYFRIIDPDTLVDIENVRNGALIAVAAFVGTTRLIDNLLTAPR